MRQFLPLIPVLLFIGCGQLPFLGDSESKKHLEHKAEEKKIQTFDGSLRTNYPAGSTQNLNLNASGNSKIDLKLPAVDANGKVVWETNQRNRMREESKDEFSIDEWVKSVSPAGWALLCLCLSVLIGVVWWFFKTTSAGRATDAALGASINFARDTAGALNNKLKNLDPKSEAWTSANEMADSNERLLQDLLSKQNPGRR